MAKVRAKKKSSAAKKPSTKTTASTRKPSAKKPASTKKPAKKKSSAAKKKSSAAKKPSTAKKKSSAAKTTSTKKPSTKKTPTKKPSTKKSASVHLAQVYEGVALIEAVIARVRDQGFAALGTCGVPRQARPVPVPPDRLAALEFPGGRPLSPALRRWLAFDARWLGWFEDPSAPVFRPLDIGRYAEREYGMTWGFEALAKKFLRGDCYGLHFGADSRRFLYVGEPDAIGEYPVLLTDTDDLPFLCVEHPGIDVYLGVFSGLIDDEDGGCYGRLADDRRYRARMMQHQAQALHGYPSVELYGDLVLDAEGDPIEHIRVPRGGEPPRDAIEAFDPFTKQTYWYRKKRLPGFG